MTTLLTSRPEAASWSVACYRPAHDRETRSWVERPWILGGQNPVVRPEDLHRFAQRKLIDLTRLPRGWDGGNARPIQGSVVAGLVPIVEFLVSSDNSATPQISPDAAGGATVEWLVFGETVGVRFDGQEFSIWGEHADGSDAFESVELNHLDSGEEVRKRLAVALMSARKFLESMSRNVNHRVPVE